MDYTQYITISRDTERRTSFSFMPFGWAYPHKRYEGDDLHLCPKTKEAESHLVRLCLFNAKIY